MNYNFDELHSEVKNGTFQLIGTGSSRRVYDLGNEHVLKVAKDIRGIHQNTAEHKIYQLQKSNMFAEILAVSEDYRFLVMPKATKINNMSIVYNFYKVKDFKRLFKLHSLDEDIKLNKLGKGDLRRATSWGIINEVPLIIDYGLTHSIYYKYYKYKLLKRKPRPLDL